jgi:hypothetical protein
MRDHITHQKKVSTSGKDDQSIEVAQNDVLLIEWLVRSARSILEQEEIRERMNSPDSEIDDED